MIRYHIARTPNRKPRISRIFYITHLLFFLTLIFSFAYAGEYHNSAWKGAPTSGDTLACSQCHTMHGSQGNVSMVYGGAAMVGNIKLLRHATIQQLCLFCHDGNQAATQIESGRIPPDIWGVTLASGQINPSGGNFCSGGTDLSNPPCNDTTTNHTIGLANIIPPGGSVTFSEFTCVNCHNPHGTKNYRNLRGGAGVTDSYGGVDFSNVNASYRMLSTATCSDGTAGPCYVENDGSVSPPTGVAKYETNNVKFRKSPTNSATDGIQAFCKKCHTLFHGAAGELSGGLPTVGGAEPATPWVRHPTLNTNISTAASATNLHADLSCWTTGTTVGGCAEAFTTWNRVIDPNGTVHDGDEIPFCLTCHRAHGSTRHSNLIYGGAALSTKGDLDLTEVGWSNKMMRSTCNQCHNQ